MPAVPFIAVALGASGALTAIGTAIAGIAGLSVATGTVAASLAAGTISTAAATAIGAGTFAGLSTAIQGGKPSQILKSAVLGGVTSYAGSAIAGSIGDSVRASAMLSGTDQAIANAMGRVAGSAISGAISSGTSALLTGQGDPIQALLKGGITAAFSAGVGESVNSVLSKVPALANPLNNTEAAINRAMSAAIGTAIVSGGDVNKIGTAVLNSFAATAGGLIGQQIRDSSSQLSNANEQFRASERAYANNIQSQESLVNQYNNAIQPIINGKAQLDELVSQYDNLAWKYNNYHTWLTNEGYHLRSQWDEYGVNSYYVKSVFQQNIPIYYDDGSVRFGSGWTDEPLPNSMLQDSIFNQAKAIESQATSLAQNLNSQYTSLFGGEVTKYRTEIQPQLLDAGYGDTAYQYWANVEVQVPYTEIVTGSLTPIKNQIDQLKSQTETLGQNYASAKTNLENAVANFNTTETANAAIVEQQLQNFTTARDQYKQQFGKEPTEEQLTNFARTGDILGTVGKLIADDRNENFAKEAGFKNYADFTAAGQVAPNEFYAKQQGWNSYAEQLKAQGMGLNTPQQYTTYQNNEQTAISQGFANYQDLQAAGNLPANDFYAKQSGWESYAQKQEAESVGLYNPSAWTSYKQFPDYKTYELYNGNVNEYKANQAGWESFADQQDAAKYEITSPQKYNEFLSGKTEEDKIAQMLTDRGITPSPERVADIMVAWNFNPATPNVGFTEALDKSDKINISNSRADTVQEAAALAKSLGYTNFAFGGSEYKINPQASTANPYNFFAGFDDAFKAARADLGPGKNFEWTNPATGETKTFTTNNQKEQAVADQKRIDLMPAYTGEGAYTRTGNPGIVPEIYFDKNTGNVVQDTRVWDENGKLVGGEVKNINPNESGSTTEKLAASIKESFGKTFDAFKYVTSGLNKGGWELLNQVGVLGGLTGLVDMDNWATRTAKEMKSVIDGYQNKEFLNNKELMYKAIEKAGDAGIFAQAVEAAKQFGVNPLQTAEFIAQQGASLLLGGGAMATARALGAGLTGQQAAAIGTMAAAQGASVADEAYRDALKNNKTPEEAINAARVAWAGAALTSAVSNKFIPGALSNESVIAAQNIAKTSLRNALKGEMSAELAEETSGKIIGNLAAGNAWDKDLGSTAVQALIGSGGVTGLVQMAPISNPETAILIAKDAGVTDQKFDDIKNVFSGTVGTQNFNLPQAKEQIIEILGSSNLNPDYFTQVSDLIARDAIKDAVFTNFEKAGVPLDKIDEVANLTATQIFNNENPQTAISDVSNALQSSGLDPLQASLIANQTLTGTDVRKVVADQFKAIGYTPTQEEINNLIGQNVLAKPADINLSVESYTAPRFVTKEEAKEALTASGIKNPADALVNSLVGQYDQSSLTSKAEEIGKNPLTQILNNIASQQNAPLDISALQKSLSDQIAANEAAGLSRDAATNKAITDVATNLGVTRDALMAQIGQTQAGLEQLGAGQAQTQAALAQMDAATKAKFDQLNEAQKAQALELANATKDLQGSINTVAENVARSEQATKEQIGGVQKGLEEKLSAQGKEFFDALRQQGVDYNTALTEATNKQNEAAAAAQRETQAQIQNTRDILAGQIAANEKAGLDRDAATNKAITDLSTRMGVDREAFLTGLGMTEERLKGEFTTGLTGLTGQISDLQKQIEEQQKEEEERQKQEEERQKLEAARSLVSSARNAAEQRMTSGASAMSALAALGSVGRGAPDEFKPLLPQFLTSKGGQTGYKGLLEDFQQQVEGRTDMPDNQVSQESQGSKDMAPYYSYGNETSLDQILGQDQESQQFAAGGLAQPLMAAGTRYGKYAAGGMPSPLMAAGGKMRVDFRDGDAVTGPGDGQSDDIPAMLADGEFVFPADVVAAIGNGSTKAGSDKLYDMMHSIRSHVRSAKPKDLPPEIKSPLDFLKNYKKSNKTRRA